MAGPDRGASTGALVSLSLRVLAVGTLVAAMTAAAASVVAGQVPGNARLERGAYVRLQGELLSVETNGVDWPELVAAWERATGVPLRLLFQPPGRPTASFRDVPFERGLRRLVGPEPALVVIYEASARSASEAVPVETWVLAPGSAPRGTPKPESRPDATAAAGAVSAPADPTLEARLAAVRARVADDDTAVPPLLEALRDPVPAIRQASAETLGDLVAEAAVGDLARSLRDPDTGVMDAAATALAQIGSRLAFIELAQALAGPDERVRSAAREALETVDRDHVMDVLRAASNDPDRRVRQLAPVARQAIDSFWPPEEEE
jgi:hypothetical protein